jgi:serine/threonine protein kinase
VFAPEADSLKLCNHPNIVKLVDAYGGAKPGSVLILEYCKGK